MLNFDKKKKIKMLLKKTNIKSELLKNKISLERLDLLAEVDRVLNTHQTPEKRINKELNGVFTKSPTENSFVFELLESNQIFHLDHIKKTCVDFRLRFLDSKYFKGQIPKSALQRIKKLEAEHGIELKGFKIMAPSKLFKLADKDDPLLFAPIGNGYYYLIHKWGNDLHPMRKLLVWPFKSIVNLTFFVLLVSYLATCLVPEGLFSKTNGSSEFWIVFFFMFKSLAAVVIFYGFALGKNFNPAIWNSKYFNA